MLIQCVQRQVFLFCRLRGLWVLVAFFGVTARGVPCSEEGVPHSGSADSRDLFALSPQQIIAGRSGRYPILQEK